MLKAYLPKEVDPSKDLFISSLICDDEVYFSDFNYFNKVVEIIASC